LHDQSTLPCVEAFADKKETERLKRREYVLTSCWVIGLSENELLVGQLTEYQLWWLTQRCLLFAFLAAAGLLASISFGWTCLGVKDAIFFAAIEELVDV
jgi:hypothetical protein